VADGQDRVGPDRFAKRDIELKDANQKSCNDVDAGYKNGGDGVALVEARRAIHCTVKFRLTSDLLATRASLCFFDKAGLQVSIDCQLRAGQSIESEACRDLCRAYRTVAHDNVLNGNQGYEQHNPDDVVAADDELPKGFDHASGCACTLVAVKQNPPARGQI